MKKFTKKPSKKQVEALLKRLKVWTIVLGFLLAVVKLLQTLLPILGGLFGI